MTKPPPVLTGTIVLEYVIVDQMQQYLELGPLLVGDEVIGKVPGLAICESQDHSGFDVLHCDEEWNVLAGTFGHESVPAAKAKAELSYPGLHDKWLATNYTEQDVTGYWREHADETCSFCGRNPYQIESLITTAAGAAEAGICNHCVEEF
jgi:hypothetical protein